MIDINTEEGMRAAVQWTERLISCVKDGGTWIVPRSGSVYEIDKTNRRVTVRFEWQRDEAIERVFEAMKYTVVR